MSEREPFPDLNQSCERMIVAWRSLRRAGYQDEARQLVGRFVNAMDDGDEAWMRTHLGEAEALVAKAGLA